MVKQLSQIILFTSAVICSNSCSEDIEKQDLWIDSESKITIEKLITEGDLLIKTTQNAENYTFFFESDTLDIPRYYISNIKEEPELWRTILTLNDNQTFTIPTMGSSLDHVIKKITVNPSGYNPLAANAHIELPAKGRVKIIIHGKNGDNGTIEHLYPTNDFIQEITILGLYADYNNQVDFIFTDKNGKERKSTHLEIKTESLNGIPLPQIKQTLALPEKMEPGMTLVNYLGETDIDTHCPFMLDSEGEIRWVLALKKNPKLEHIISHCGFQRMKNGNFISGDAYNDQLVEIDMLGNQINSWSLKDKGYSFHHEVIETSAGNLLATVSKKDAQLPDGQARSYDYLIELDPKQDKIVREWDLASMLDVEHYKYLNSEENPGDWAHNNAVFETNDGLIVSMRYTGIMKFDFSGKIIWLLSPHKGWGDKWVPYLLQPLDKSGKIINDSDILSGNKRTDDFDWSWGAHCPLIKPNGNLLVFDNGFFRQFEDIDLYSQKGYSRAVEYKINEDAHTVQQIWQYGEERKRSCFSVALSSTSYLPKRDHVLFAPGVGTPNANGVGGKIIEVDYKTKEIVYEIHISTASFMAFHRASRMPLYPENL